MNNEMIKTEIQLQEAFERIDKDEINEMKDEFLSNEWYWEFVESWEFESEVEAYAEYWRWEMEDSVVEDLIKICNFPKEVLKEDWSTLDSFSVVRELI